jgi:CheY-like chemotaxis protein
LNADVTRLTQVFANLISNAVRYTPPGGRIQLSAEVHGASLAARVSDTGIGIPGEMLPRIFDLFTQAQPATEHSNGGLGVGLTLARRLIEMHGGSITAESAGVGAGSTFTVSLPLAQGVECNPSLPRARTEADTRHRRILVVDDNIDAAETVALLLAQEGHETRVAHDGETALANAEEFHAEVVLLDLGLPGLSGLEVARRLRRQAHTPESVLLVALTGWGSEEDRRQAQSAGFDRHLVKPVELDKLLEAVRDG